MSVLEAKAQFKEVTDYIRATGESVILTKNGEPYVVLKPVPEEIALPNKSKKSLK
jgi:prevent-host-death family protein